MMYTLKGWWRATATFLLVALCRGDPLGQGERQLQQRYSDPVIPLFPQHLAPPWEYILREIILKSINPPPPSDARMPHKRPLDATFYGGPLATHSNDDTNVILSRGNVYRLLNGHWMLCQNGCIDCELCAAQRDPSFKWILRRVERSPSADPPRHELQLTITPQTDDRLHASDFWPNSYVYVTSQGQRGASIVSVGPRDGRPSDPEISTTSGLEDSFSAQHQRSRNPWRLAERDSAANRDDDRTTTRKSVSSTEAVGKEEFPEQKQRPRNVRPRYRPQPRATENLREEVNQLAPKLILGTDRRGQKHLIHVVPADHPPSITRNPNIPNHLIPSQFMVNQMRSNDTIVSERERQTYQQIFRRIFESLNTHRRSIQDFLEVDNVGRHHQTSPAMDVARFTWNNHTVGNFAPLHRGDTILSPFYVENEGRTAKRRRHEDTKRNVNDYYARYWDTNYAERSRSQLPMSFIWDEERRKVRVQPYSTNSRGISGISSSISSQTSGNFSADAGSRFGFGNSFVNGTLIGKANNNSIKPSSITTRRGNDQLLRSERLKSGDANREFEASHHPFRIIVTTESPVIRGEHEALNHTKTLQITTLKTFE